MLKPSELVLKPCKRCLESAEIVLTQNNGWCVVCSCGKSRGGYKREVWAIEAWNYDN